jgi:long-subunit acyl-CoA synthetase (AMP-forming)
VRGLEVCVGYLDAGHTPTRSPPDGWFRTGDSDVDDDGFTIVGRPGD